MMNITIRIITKDQRAREIEHSVKDEVWERYRRSPASFLSGVVKVASPGSRYVSHKVKRS